jgi:hypothetical protein
VLFFLLSVWARASDEAHVHMGIETVVSKPESEIESEVSANLQASVPVAEHVDVTVYSRLAPAYGVAYVGPSFHLRRFVFTPSLGLETHADMSLRGAVTAALNTDRFRALGIAEYGGTGFWGKAQAAYWLFHGHAGLGAFIQRYDGLGPWLGFEYEHFEIWTAAVYDFEDTTQGVVAGFDWSR